MGIFTYPNSPISPQKLAHRLPQKVWSTNLSTPVQRQNIIRKGRALNESLKRVPNYIVWIMSNWRNVNVSNLGRQILPHVGSRNARPNPMRILPHLFPEHNPMHVKAIVYGHICNGALFVFARLGRWQIWRGEFNWQISSPSW